MKSINISRSIVIILSMFLLHSCKKEVIPTLSTSTIANITATTASSGGNITSDGGTEVIVRGVCWGINENPSTKDSKTIDNRGTGQYVSNISGLTAGSTYHVRAYATNSVGTAYGADLLFTTLGQAPEAITQAASDILSSGATLNGIVNANNVSTTVTFEYGITNAYGSSVAGAPSTISGNNSTSVSAIITGLNSGATYHFRIKAENSLGTTYGNDMSFPTLSTVTDVDGNTYNYVVIGGQTWMKENLKVTRYRNGDLIGTTVPATLDISSEAAPKYQWAYDGNESNVAIYGRLYSWYAITDSRNLCPVGWHVPTDSEWTVLSDFLGGSVVAGNKLKEIGTTHWLEPNTGATNETGFTALPGGLRTPKGNFGNLQNDGTWVRNDGNWWSSTAYDAGTAWDRVMSPIYPNVGRWNYNKAGGLSVRCLRD